MARVANIKKIDVANGPGVRVSVFFSGCTLHCKGCFNHEEQDFSVGKTYGQEIVDEVLEMLDREYVSGISYLGGDPMEPSNQAAVLDLSSKVLEAYPNLSQWLWTGRLLDRDLVTGGNSYVEGVTDSLLQNLDVVVDGPFVEAKKDLKIKWRGSSNQRVWIRKNGDWVVAEEAAL